MKKLFKPRTLAVLTILLMVVVAGLPLKVLADSKTIEPSRDTYIDSEIPSASYGAIGLGTIGYKAMGSYNKITLLHFDTSSIPAGSVIESAKLTVRIGGCTGSEPSAGHVSLGGYINNSSPGWTESSTYQQLSTSGSSLDGVGSQIVPCNMGSYVDFNAVELVKAWVDRSISNDGLYLSPVSGGGSNWTRVIYMREATAASRPKLTINYSVPYEHVDSPDGGTSEASPDSASSHTIKAQSGSQPLDPDKSLSPPTQLTASQEKSTLAIRLNWEESNSENVSHYRIFRMEVDESGLDKRIGEVASSETTFTDKDTQAGKTYGYFIRAVRNDKESVNTDIVQIQAVSLAETATDTSNSTEMPEGRLSHVPALMGAVTILITAAFIVLLLKHRELHHKHKALRKKHLTQEEPSELK